MNENIDLTKILKNCPKGWEFYSSVYGEVRFVEITPIRPVPYRQKDDELFMAEVMMEREYPIKLMVNICEYRVSKAGEHKKGVGECTLFPSREQRDWSKFTAPWLKKERFDPKTLKVFDRVLVRFDCGAWSATLFSHLIDSKFANKKYDIICCGSVFGYCIPYNDDTKHLVGTKDEAPDFYRYWED